MEETLTKEKQSSCWKGVKSYLIGLGIYLAISLIVALFFIKYFRHLWISHHAEPLTEYIITDTDYDLEESTERDEDGEYVHHEDYTYYLLMDVKGKEYRVETSKKIYKRVDESGVTHFDTDDVRFFYDESREKVFLGGYYPDAFYIFLGAFVVLFVIIFVYLPIKFAKDKKKSEAGSPDTAKGQDA